MSFFATYYPPDEAISEYVSTYWFIENTSEIRDVTMVPDAYFDLILSKGEHIPYNISLLGVATTFEDKREMPIVKMFGISFKLIASEYILGQSIASIKNDALKLPLDFWDFNENDLSDIPQLIAKTNSKIAQLIPLEIDLRKKKLFDLLYANKGDISVQELATQSYWSSRQINRYFNLQFGISLKSYCNFLRFRNSYIHLKEGKLFPELNFADQAHFIRMVKKLTGVSPKELSRNKNDRFIQFLANPVE